MASWLHMHPLTLLQSPSLDVQSARPQPKRSTTCLLRLARAWHLLWPALPYLRSHDSSSTLTVFRECLALQSRRDGVIMIRLESQGPFPWTQIIIRPVRRQGPPACFAPASSALDTRPVSASWPTALGSQRASLGAAQALKARRPAHCTRARALPQPAPPRCLPE